MSQCPLKAAKAKLIEKQNLLKKAEEEVKIAEEEYRWHLYLNPMNFYPRFQHVTEKIFQNLDMITLKNCRQVAKSWQNCIDIQNIL